MKKSNLSIVAMLIFIAVMLLPMTAWAAPVLSITSPTSSPQPVYARANGPVSIGINYNAAEPVTATVYIYDINDTKVCEYTTTSISAGNNKTASIPVIIGAGAAEGVADVTVLLSDSEGSTSETNYGAIRIDNTLPIVNLTSPQTVSYVRPSAVIGGISFQYTEAFPYRYSIQIKNATKVIASSQVTSGIQAGSFTISDKSLTLSTTAPDGIYDIVVNFIDYSGNSNASTLVGKVVVDTIAPTFEITATPDPAKAGEVTITAIASEELSVAPMVYVNEGIDPLTFDSQDGLTYTYTYEVTNENKDIPISIWGTDLTGNTNEQAPSEGSFLADTLAPNIPVVDFTPDFINIANKAAVAITGTVEANASVSLFVYDESWGTPVTAQTTADVDGNYSFSLDLSSLEDGTVTAVVYATDKAGNTSSEGTTIITKDAVAPEAPLLTSPVQDFYIFEGNADAFGLSGTAEPDSKVTLFNFSDLFADTTSIGGNWETTVNMSAFAEGAFEITAYATDAAGNTSVASYAYLGNKDTVDPTFEISVDPLLAKAGDVSITVKASEKLEGTPVVKVGQVDITQSGSYSELTDAYTYTYSITNENGELAISVTGTDVAGNVGNVITSGGTFTADTINPEVTSVTPNAEATVYSATDIEWEITEINGVDTGATVIGVFGELSGDIAGSITGWNQEDGTLTWVPTSPLATDNFTVSLLVYDNAGNYTQYNSTFENVVDTDKPVVESVTPAKGYSTNNTNSTITATLSDVGPAGINWDESYITLTGAANGTINGSLTLNESNGIVFTPSAALPQGTYTVTVIAIDKAGNSSDTWTSTFYLDVTKPVVISVSPANSSNVNSVSISATLSDAFTGIDGTESSFELYDNNENEIALTNIAWNSETGLLTADTAEPLTDGFYYLDVYAYDKAGNSTESYTSFVYDKTNPIITPNTPTKTTDISVNRPTTFTATASEPITWEVTVFNPYNVQVAAFTRITPNTSFTNIWAPSSAYAPSGTYTIKYNGIDVAGNIAVEKTQTVEVYNEPIKITQVRVLNNVGAAQSTFSKGATYQIEAAIENLENFVVAPMIIVKVKDGSGQVVNIGTAKISSFAGGATIALTSGTTIPSFALSGNYSVEVMVWSGWTDIEIMSSDYTKSNAFTVN